MERLILLMQRAEAGSLEYILTAKLELHILLYRTVVHKENISTERALELLETWAQKHNKGMLFIVRAL